MQFWKNAEVTTFNSKCAIKVVVENVVFAIPIFYKVIFSFMFGMFNISFSRLTFAYCFYIPVFVSLAFHYQPWNYGFLVLRKPSNAIQYGPFWGCLLTDGIRKGSPSKICHTFFTIIKLSIVTASLKRIQKIYKLRDTLLKFC